MTWWKWLDKEIKNKGISPYRVAADANMSHSAIEQIINFKRNSRIDTVEKVCKALGKWYNPFEEEPIEPIIRGPCTDAELRDCLERYSGLDERGIRDIMKIVQGIATESQGERRAAGGGSA